MTWDGGRLHWETATAPSGRVAFLGDVVVGRAPQRGPPGHRARAVREAVADILARQGHIVAGGEPHVRVEYNRTAIWYRDAC